MQGVFQHVKGVTNAVSGYAGGDKRTAHYEEIGTGRTGHAESVEVTYDPRVISYGRLLQILFSVAHDPTQLDRQGPDVGPQYRSAISRTTWQASVAKAYIDQLMQARVFSTAIVTRIEPGASFYAAEPYHQDFLTRHPDASVHRLQRPSEGEGPAEDVPRCLSGPACARRLEALIRGQTCVSTVV